YGTGLSANDVLMIAVKYVNSTTLMVWFGKNGTWFGSGDPATEANPSATLTMTGQPAFIASYHFSTAAVEHFNFGQRPFAYAAPSGFKCLCTQNLPDPAIKNPKKYFDVLTWAGDGAAPTRSFNDLLFQPDFALLKTRDEVRSWTLWDAVRGAGVNKELATQSDAQQGGVA